MASIRRAGAVSGAALSGLVLAFGVAHAVAPRWAARVGLDVWNFPAAREEAREIAGRAESLRTERDRLARELDFTGHVAARLAAGKLSLRDATEQLAPLLERRTGFQTTWRFTYQSPSFRHGVARYAIIQVELALRGDPGDWAELAPQLEAQYAVLD
jgi:hypothetical protein